MRTMWKYEIIGGWDHDRDEAMIITSNQMPTVQLYDEGRHSELYVDDVKIIFGAPIRFEKELPPEEKGYSQRCCSKIREAIERMKEAVDRVIPSRRSEIKKIADTFEENASAILGNQAEKDQDFFEPF